jgi:hypothetical protein
MTIDVEIDLRPDLLKVRDQGPRSTCLSHAVSAAHEHVRQSSCYLSPEYLHYFAAGGVVSSGVSFAEASQTLASKGQPEDSECLYQATDPPAGWSPKPVLRVYRRASNPASVRPARIEHYLRSGKAPILGISLPKGFFSPSSPWVLASDGPLFGHHTVLATGFGRCPASGLVLIRNSWGTTWGDGGYAWLDDQFLQTHLKEMLILAEEVF